MAEFIAPVIDAVLAALQARMPGTVPVDREQIVDYGKQFTAGFKSFPSLYVMPLRTAFDPDAQDFYRQAHQVQIIVAVTGSTPDEVTEAAMAYVAAVHQAIDAADAAGEIAVTDGQVLRVFVSGHDYGPLWEKSGTMARFPAVELTVEDVEQ